MNKHRGDLSSILFIWEILYGRVLSNSVQVYFSLKYENYSNSLSGTFFFIPLLFHPDSYWICFFQPPRQALGGLRKALGGLRQALGGLCQALGGLSQSLGALSQALGCLNQALGGLRQALEGLT